MTKLLRRLVLSAAATCALGACASTRPSESLTLRELTIVDQNGTPRVRIGAPLPDPQGLKRAVTAIGIQFMDPKGNEIGGLAMLEPIGVNGLCFDSTEGYEAMCIGLVKGQPSITFRHDWKERITLGVDNGVAGITLHDAQGNARMKLEVDKDGKTRVEGVTPAGR